MASWAKPGVKVQCIYGGPAGAYAYSVLPVEGEIYTISSVQNFTWPKGESGVGIHLAEIDRPAWRPTGIVYPWGIFRFKPLITKTQEQDIEMFLRIANDTPFSSRLTRKPTPNTNPLCLMEREYE